MILTPYGIDHLAFWNSSLKSFDFSNSNSFSGFHLDSYPLFDSIFLILPPEFDPSILKLVAEIRARSGSVVKS